jgi:hypothetical protein
MSSAGSYGGGGGSKPHVLYGVWIDEALQSNDAGKMREVLQEVRKQYPSGPRGPIIPLYGVFINRCLEDKRIPKEELEHLLAHAKSVKDSNLDDAISKLEAHLGKK